MLSSRGLHTEEPGPPDEDMDGVIADCENVKRQLPNGVRSAPHDKGAVIPPTGGQPRGMVHRSTHFL